MTPVRALINEGAALVPAERLAFCVVGESEHASDLHSVSFGDTIASWANAAEVCAATHVTYLDAPVDRVLSIVPAMYEDIWTGAKGFYKLEPVVADGGEVDPLRPAHHRDLDEPPGDQRDRLPLPRLLREAVGPVQAHPLGHARALDPPARRGHLRRRDRRGAAARAGSPWRRGIPEEVCRAANLGYLDPASVDVAAEAEPGTFVVPNAGEVLFRLR